jgi:MbtH protein
MEGSAVGQRCLRGYFVHREAMFQWNGHFARISVPVGDDAQGTYLVVVNDEEQYPVWAGEAAAPGGMAGGRQARAECDCLAYVDEVWTDMRPLSLRRAMNETAGG